MHIRLQNTIWKVILVLSVLTSCDGQAEQERYLPAIKPAIADYKSDTYKITLGEGYKISDKVIDWRWAAMNDKDNKIDSAGADAFLYLDAPGRKNGPMH